MKQIKPLLVKLRRLVRRKRTRQVFSGLVVIFVLVNIWLVGAYGQTTYPRTQVAGKELGGVKFADLATRAGSPPASITVYVKGKTQKLSTKSLKLSVDEAKITDTIKRERSWLPIVNMFRSHHAPRFVRYEQGALDKLAGSLVSRYKAPAVNARIQLEAGKFRVVAERSGYRLDKAEIKQAIVGALENGQDKPVLPTNTVDPAKRRSDLEPALQRLQAQQSTAVTYRYKGKTHVFTPAAVSGWYQVSGASYVLADAKIRDSVVSIGLGFGIGVQNLEQAVSATRRALESKKPLDFTLKPAPLAKKSFSYCVAARGVPTSYLSGLSAKLATVYADARGWNLGGQVRLSKTSGGCDFTVWLSAAGQMPSFGSICDPLWSCRVGRNVVINFDRWRFASDAWNKSGGSLDNYRAMVINHETGHWFGFGHSGCGGPGQRAPVMQQQSISLAGCKFNPWPLASEQAALKASLGL